MDNQLEVMHRDRFPVIIAAIIAVLAGLAAMFLWPG